MVSPYVQRNLDSAQYAQPRGSQYEGPRSEFEEENDNVFEDAGTYLDRRIEEAATSGPSNVCYRHPLNTIHYGICPVCDIERDEELEDERLDGHLSGYAAGYY